MNYRKIKVGISGNSKTDIKIIKLLSYNLKIKNCLLNI